VKLNFLAIDKAQNDFKSIFSGFIGIAPYSAKGRSKDLNFMY
jgi:hypothetical protein